MRLFLSLSQTSTPRTPGNCTTAVSGVRGRNSPKQRGVCLPECSHARRGHFYALHLEIARG
eukprot:469241-Lingulodinium_polyedra.AAC.1